MNARCHDCGCVSFPLNVADGAMRDAQVGEPGSHSFAEHPDAGAQFDGMNSHMVGHQNGKIEWWPQRVQRNA